MDIEEIDILNEVCMLKYPSLSSAEQETSSNSGKIDIITKAF